ncbi:MAG: hypothetical protein ACI9Y1_003170 [Lentisphaeria bacterium]|jgi:hypothetical protein
MTNEQATEIAPKVGRLVVEARRRGHVSLNDISEVFPPHIKDQNMLDDLVSMMRNMGLEVSGQ